MSKCWWCHTESERPLCPECASESNARALVSRRMNSGCKNPPKVAGRTTFNKRKKQTETAHMSLGLRDHTYVQVEG